MVEQALQVPGSTMEEPEEWEKEIDIGDSDTSDWSDDELDEWFENMVFDEQTEEIPLTTLKPCKAALLLQDSEGKMQKQVAYMDPGAQPLFWWTPWRRHFTKRMYETATRASQEQW